MTAKLTQTAKTFRKEASAPQGDGTAPQRGYACRKSARMKRHRNETDKQQRILEAEGEAQAILAVQKANSDAICGPWARRAGVAV